MLVQYQKFVYIPLTISIIPSPYPIDCFVNFPRSKIRQPGKIEKNKERYDVKLKMKLRIKKSIIKIIDNFKDIVWVFISE